MDVIRKEGEKNYREFTLTPPPLKMRCKLAAKPQNNSPDCATSMGIIHIRNDSFNFVLDGYFIYPSFSLLQFIRIKRVVIMAERSGDTAR